MGNNKCKPVDFDCVETVVTNVPFASLDPSVKDKLVTMLKEIIARGKDNAIGFDIPGVEVYITPHTTVDLYDVITYAMRQLGVNRPYILVKDVKRVQYHVLFVQDL